MEDQLAVSCVFAPSLRTPEHIATAEALGYARAWCYDSPAAYADPWMVLALAAERTSRIGLGPATLVPSLRHPMVTAAALATLAGLAPGRISAAFGTGLTGRLLLGERPLRWADVAAYVRAVRALLDGADVEWDGQVLRMVQPAGYAADRPVELALLLAADGPKGAAIAEELDAGVVSTRAPATPTGRRRIMLTFGTVLDEGESSSSERAVAAAGPALAAAYHAIYEARGPAGVARLPGGPEWGEAIATIDPARRHLAIHEGHLVAVNEYDGIFVGPAASLLGTWTMTGLPSDIRARLDTLCSAGVTEVAYQPMGPDIDRELEAFASAAGLARG